jgi:hypothetical protein
MAFNLDNAYATSTTESTGVGKDETGSVAIQPTDNEPVEIKTTDDTVAFTVNDDASIQLNSGITVDQISGVWNPGDVNFAKQIFNGPAIQAAIDTVSGVNHFEFSTKAAFDAYVFIESEMPAQAYVSDSVPFSYTDDYGKSITNVDWMIVHLHWDVSSAETHIMSSSADSSQLTASEIKTLYESNANTNAFNDTYKGQLDNAPANINNEFATKQSSIDTNATNISNLQSGKADINSANIFSAQQGFDNSSAAQLYTKNSGVGTLSSIGHKDLGTGNFRAGTGYDDTNDIFFIKIGNQVSFANLSNRLEMSTSNADFKVNLQVQGNDVLDVSNYSLIKTGIDSIADTNFLTDAEQTKLSNVPANTNTELSGKLSLSGGTMTGDVIFSGNDIRLTNPGTGLGRLLFNNTNAPVNQKEYEFQARSGGYLELETNNDSDVAQNSFKFYHGGNFELDGVITQNSNAVLDSSDIVNNIASGGANTLSDNPTIKAYILSNAGTFDGGTVTSTIIGSMSSSTEVPFLAKRDNDVNDLIILAAQNSGSNYIKSIYVDESDGEKLKIATGDTPTITSLVDRFEVGSNVIINNSSQQASTLSLENAVDGNAMGIGFRKSNGNYGASVYVEQNGTDSSKYDLILKAGDNADPINMSTLLTLDGLNQEVETKNLRNTGTAYNFGQLRVSDHTSIGSTVSPNDYLHIIAGGSSVLGSMTEPNKRGLLVTCNTGPRITWEDPSHTVNNRALVARYESGVLRFATLADTGNSWTNDDILRIDTSTKNLEVGGKLVLKDYNLNDCYVGVNEASPVHTGVTVRTTATLPSGGAIFRVESVGNSPRLHVEHDGKLATSNEEIKVGISSDGTGGRTVLEEGNWALIQKAQYYSNTFPTLSLADVVAWSGRNVYFFGIGAGTITMPSIVASNPSSTQVEEGETFTIFNFNTSSDVTFTAASGQKWMVNNVDAGNISPTGATFTVFASTRVVFTATNLTGYAPVGAMCWAVTGI